MIVLRDQASANAALEAAKRAATAAQWGEVVRARSIDPGAKGNVPVDLVGDFGIVSPPGEVQVEPNAKVPPEVRAALFQITKIGDVYDKPVRAADGRFFVLRMTQKTEPHDRSFAEAERSIRTRLVQEKIHAQEEAFVARLKADYPVKIDDAVLATVRVDLPPDSGAAAPEADASAAPSTQPVQPSLPAPAPAPALRDR